MKNVYKIFLLYWLIMLGCKPSKGIIGQYKYKDGTEVKLLDIDSSKKFKYYHTLGLMSIYSEGEWWVMKDSLVLKSNPEITSVNGKVIESRDSSDVYKLQVSDEYAKVKVQNLLVVINDKDSLYTNKEGQIKYSKPISTIFINYQERYDFFYDVQNKNSNSLDVYLIALNTSVKYFLLEKFLIRRAKLIRGTDVFLKN